MFNGSVAISRRDARGLLLAAAVITLVAWQLPLGRMALYPFTLLATYAHEMGHGLTALIVGGSFEALEMYPDGSGLARWSGSVGAFGRAFVAAGGLVGPSIAGAAVLLLSRDPKRAPRLLFALAVLMGLSVLLFARSLFAVAFVVASAACFAGVAKYGAKTIAPFFVQLVGVQLCLSVFRDVSYMFSEGAMVGGKLRPSDSAAIADALWLPYWFWGGAVAVLAFGVLAGALYLALRGPPSAP